MKYARLKYDKIPQIRLFVKDTNKNVLIIMDRAMR